MARSEKEGLVLVLDVGQSMSTRNGTSTYLQNCADIIQMIIQRKMFQSSKDEIGLELFGTNETANDLYDSKSDHYSHIVLARPLAEVDWKLIDYVHNKLNATNINGDLLDALTVATDHIHSRSQKQKFNEKRILIFTDYSSLSEDENIDEITQALKSMNIRLDVVSPFAEEDGEDDDDDGRRKKGRSQAASNRMDSDDEDHPRGSNGHADGKKRMTREQKHNQKIMKKILSQNEGAMYSFEEVLTLLSVYQTKSVRSTGTKYVLDIGENFRLPVVSMIKIKENKPEMFRLKKVYAKDENVELKTDRARFTKDEEQKDLDDKSEVVDAYRYGSTYVPIDDAQTLRLAAEKCFSLLGFTKADNVKRYYFMGDSVHQILPDLANCDEDAQAAFISMVEAMFEENVYGIVRKVFSVRSSPELGCLIPYISHEITCLLYIELPFEDDIRKFTLENLSSLKKYKPSEKQLELIDDLIDNMDLSNFNEKSKNEDDDDEDAMEAYDPKLTFNPYIQRMFQTIALKATNPDAELPDFEQHITNRYTRRYDEKIRNEKTKELLKRCASEFPTRDLDTKKQKVDAKEIFGTSDNKPKSDDGSKKDAEKNGKDEEENKNLAIDDLYQTISSSLNKVRKIGTINPVNDFNVLIANADTNNDYESLCDQVVTLIKQFLSESISSGDDSSSDTDAFQSKSADCIKALRDASLKHKKVDWFNTFLKDFKKYLFESPENKRYLERLRLFWKHYLLNTKLSLITTTDDSSSSISQQEADEFLTLPEVEAVRVEEKAAKTEEDVEDLLDLM